MHAIHATWAVELAETYNARTPKALCVCVARILSSHKAACCAALRALAASSASFRYSFASSGSCIQVAGGAPFQHQQKQQGQQLLGVQHTQSRMQGRRGGPTATAMVCLHKQQPSPTAP